MFPNIFSSIALRCAVFVVVGDVQSSASCLRTPPLNGTQLIPSRDCVGFLCKKYHKLGSANEIIPRKNNYVISIPNYLTRKIILNLFLAEIHS